MEIDRQNRISLKLAEEGEEPTETASAPAADDGGEEG
jgi:hypothetical protein